MKIPVLALLVAFSASAIAGSAVPTSTSPTKPFAYPVSEIMQPSQPGVVRGDTQLTVLRQMGAPHRKLGPEIWVYPGYRPHVPTDRQNGCDTVIITFARGRVSDLVIANPPATTLFAANANDQNAPVRVARN